MATATRMTGMDRMLAACRRQPVDATPVWFMRQAGRCFPEYRELKEKHDLMTLFKTPELATRIALIPVKQLQVDGAVMYADIMLPLEGMGVPFHIEPDVGPIVHSPIRTQADVDAVRVVEAEEATPYVFDMVRMLRSELGENAALVGFSGAPFVLACYMIEGKPSRDYAKAKAFMFGSPELWHVFMEKVTEVVIRYLRRQVEAGIQVAQLFDSWVGMLSPSQYEQFALPYSRRVLTEIKGLGVPTIHFGTSAASLLELMASAGSDIVGVDWRVSLDDAWARIGYELGIQGNLDPAMMLAPLDVIQEGARDVLRRAGGRPGHIFNLGHGVIPETDPEDLARLVELVHEDTKRL